MVLSSIYHCCQNPSAALGRKRNREQRQKGRERSITFPFGRCLEKETLYEMTASKGSKSFQAASHKAWNSLLMKKETVNSCTVVKYLPKTPSLPAGLIHFQEWNAVTEKNAQGNWKLGSVWFNCPCRGGSVFPWQLPPLNYCAVSPPQRKFSLPADPLPSAWRLSACSQHTLNVTSSVIPRAASEAIRRSMGRKSLLSLYFCFQI